MTLNIFKNSNIELQSIIIHNTPFMKSALALIGNICLKGCFSSILNILEFRK